MTDSATGLRSLQAAIKGEVLLPSSPGYDAGRRPAIARFHDVAPRAVVRCVGAEDVATVLDVARRWGLHVVPRSGGHCFAGRSSTTGIVIDVTPMHAVSVDGGVATIGAGARLGAVYDALQHHGVTIAAGCGPSVGIAGLTLGGGLGILGRLHGLTCDRLVAATVVLADGRVVRCDEHTDADLFWGLRGAGGGQFGVVTDLSFRTLRAPVATAVHLVWPYGRAATLLDAWQVWAPDGPDELAVSLLLTAGDELEPPLAHLFGAVVGAEADAAALVDDLVARVGTPPLTATLREAPYRDIKRHLAEHGPGDTQKAAEPRAPYRAPGHERSRSEFLGAPLPSDAVQALVRHFGDSRRVGEARELDLTPWGGAYTRVRSDATAFAHRDARVLLKHSVTVDADADEGRRAAAHGWLAQSWHLVRPWGTGGVYPNFPDPDLPDAARAYHGSNLERLVRVKHTYDPDEVFHFPQSIRA